MSEVILKTDFEDLKLFSRGKVRDTYDFGEQLLMVASDRISAFDSILGSGIPLKGKVLNQLSEYWFGYTQDIVPNHLITTDVSLYPKESQKYSEQLAGRSMLVKKTQTLPIECVVRGYLAGSAWREYRENQQVCGISLPAGLRECDKLPETIFTPATKAESGHDINISFEKMGQIIGEEKAEKVRDVSIKVYEKAQKRAEQVGVIISDTKFEFGILGDQLLLVDEVLTPDSSRFWPLDDYEPGRPQNSFDKQYVRDYLEESGWNKEPPAPSLPLEVVEKTTEKYVEAFERITGKKLA